MMKQLLVAASFLALAVPPVLAQTSLAKGDVGFMQNVARDNQSEVELGQLAQQKGASPEVKALGQRLAADHGKANQQLMSIAQGGGVSLPTNLDRKERAQISKLEKLDGAAFDKTFVQAQVKDHQKDIQYFQKEAGTVKDPQLKSYIQQTLPVMQQHLQMAQQVQTQLTSSGGTAPSTKQ
jgi:putative membrane protein